MVRAPHADSDAYDHAHGDGDPDSNGHRNAYAHPDGDRHRDSRPDRDADIGVLADSNAYPEQDAYADGHA